MAQSLVQAYSIIPTVERRAALEALIRKLDRDGIRAVDDALSELRDPMAILPHELMIHVFSYLPVQEVWRLRSVSLRWNRTLSSEVSENEALVRFEALRPAPSARNRDLAPLSRRRRMRVLQAVQSHRQFAHRQITDEIAKRRSDSRLHNYWMKGKYLSYLRYGDSGSRKLVVHDMALNQSVGYTAEGRESIVATTLSENVAALLSYTGKLYVMGLEEHRTEVPMVQLPSCNILSLASSRYDVVVLEPEDQSGKYTMLIYNALSGKSTSFACIPQTIKDRGGERLVPGTLIVDSHRRVIDVFSSIREQCGYQKPFVMWFGHVRFDYSGKAICNSLLRNTGVFPVKDPAVCGSGFADDCKLGPVESVGTGSIHRIHFKCTPFPGNQTYQRTWALMFDASRATIYQLPVASRSPIHIEKLAQSEIAMRNNRLYAPTFKGMIVSSDLETNLDQCPDVEMWEKEDPDGYYLAVNDSFAVCFDTAAGSIVIDYFNEDLIPAEMTMTKYWDWRDGRDQEKE